MESRPVPFDYELFEEEYVQAYSDYRRAKRTFVGKVAQVAAPILLLSLGTVGLFLPDPVPGIVCLVLAPVLLISRYWLVPRLYRREFKRSPRLRARVAVEFSEQGMGSSSEYGSTLTPWSGFAGWIESRELLLFLFTPRMFSIIPKRVLQPEQLSALRSLATCKLGKAE